MNAATVYFTSRNGRVMNYGSDIERREGQLYVNRNNAAAERRGDSSKPYRLLAYTIPENS